MMCMCSFCTYYKCKKPKVKASVSTHNWYFNLLCLKHFLCVSCFFNSWNTYRNSVVTKVPSLFTLAPTFKSYIKDKSWKLLQIPNMPDYYSKLSLLKYEVSATQKNLTTEWGTLIVTYNWYLVLLQSSTKVWKLILGKKIQPYPFPFF